MNIVFLDAQTMGNPPNIDKLHSLGAYTEYALTTPEQVIERLTHADIAITCKVVIDKAVMQQLPNLKLICVAATGTNNIDLEYARQTGVLVKNAANYSTNSVAQATFAMLFQLLNQCNYYDAFVKNGSYSTNNMFTHYGPHVHELAGKYFGIIGLGNIGLKVATIAEAFGCHVSYYSTSGNNKNNTYPSLPLHDLLAQSDVVSIHCPLNDATKNMISAHELKLMKPSSILLNMARGGIVNEGDLANAIDENVLFGACFDVFTKEPVIADNPLLHVKHKERLVLAPHTAWISVEARTTLIEKIAANIISFQQE